MLIAEQFSGRAVDALEASRKQVAGPFRCPVCHTTVYLKAGAIMMPHFAHRSRKICQVFSEGETAEHLQGKRLLQQFFPSSYLEVYLPQIQQRPDLLLAHYAIEFQCSTLKFTRFLERTTHYQAAHFQPVWIVGQRFAPTAGWSHFQKACCYERAQVGFCLYQLAVEQGLLLCHQQLHWSYEQGYTWQTWAYTPTQSWFLHQIHGSKPPVKISYPVYLQQQLMRRSAVFLALQQQIYPLRQTLFSLSAWCYQPSKFGFLFQHKVLVLRAFFEQTSTFESWYQSCEVFLGQWQWPLLNRESLLRRFYRECELLVAQSK